MTATNDERSGNLPARLGLPLLSMLLGFVAVYGLVMHGVITRGAPSGPGPWSPSVALASSLIILGAIWGVSRGKPSRARTAVLSLLLAFAALLGFGVISTIVKILIAADFVGLRHWKTPSLLAANALVFGGAIWGLLRVRPWTALKGPDEPVSPATRRTNTLFGLSGIVSVLAVVALMVGSPDKEKPFSGVWSNGPVSLGVAAFVIAAILLSMGLAWWWYFSADEHERRANDVGFLAGGGLFLTAAPIWWVAWRAGLVPEPNAMILWYAAVVAMGIGWAWHRNR